MSVFFTRIHPLNYPLAWALSWRGPVGFWRYAWVPWGWLKRFESVDPSTYFDYDGWEAIAGEANPRWRARFAAGQPRPGDEGRARLGGLDVDLTRPWLQWLAAEYEEQVSALALFRAWRERGGEARRRARLAGTAALWNRREWGLDFEALERGTGWMDAAGAACDALWFWAQLAVFAARECAFLLRPAPEGVGAALPARARFLWAGIAPSEVPAGDGKLNFAFLVDRGLARKEDSLFLFSNVPPVSARPRLVERGVRWAVPSRWATLLPWTYRARAAAGISGIVAAACAAGVVRALALRGGSVRAAVVARLAAQALPWVYVARRYQPEVYLSSVSASWPEVPAVAAMNAFGVRTVIWHYSANVFSYSVARPGFTDLKALQSVGVAREMWVWNRETAAFFGARAVLAPEHSPRTRVLGPMMCGDSSLLALPPERARAGRVELGGARGARWFISAFDVPAISQELRLARGYGPVPYPLKMLEQFYVDLRAALERFPDAHLVLKPKRALNDPQREYPPEMWKLLDPAGPWVSSGRITLLAHDVDPYVPVAVSEVSVGLPFTSPVIAAMEAGREGIFHDPLSCVNHFKPAVYRASMTSGQAALLARLERVTSKPRTAAAGSVTWNDPGEKMARAMNGEFEVERAGRPPEVAARAQAIPRYIQ